MQVIRRCVNLFTSSADSAMKKPCVLPSILISGPGLIAMVHEPLSSERTSKAINNSFSLMKHILQHQSNAFLSHKHTKRERSKQNFKTTTTWIVRQLATTITTNLLREVLLLTAMLSPTAPIRSDQSSLTFRNEKLCNKVSDVHIVILLGSLSGQTSRLWTIGDG